jgi:hypothetical protein
LKISRHKYFQSIASKIKPNWIKRSLEINTNAGFYFENLDQAAKFYNLYHEALLSTDILGAWGTAFAWIESRYIKTIDTLIPVPMTAPWVEAYSNSDIELPWSRSLNGKKVLVVSPFTDSIEKQHVNIQNVFPNCSYPDFILKTIKAPQTIGFKSDSKPNWFNNLDKIKELMSREDFDIAIIAAGAYSYPLAHHAKTMGKIGIHAGGGLQLFFGIIGKRWETNWDDKNYLKKYFNKFWIRPSREETPNLAFQVENGCYW